MNPDILFNILLHCDINTIHSFSVVQKKFLLGKYTPKQRNYFWNTKFDKDQLKCIKNKSNTIEWINEYKKVFPIMPQVNEMVTKLLSLNTKPWAGIYMYIRDPIKILSVLPRVVHQKTTCCYEHKVSFTKTDNVISLHYDLFNSRYKRSKSTIVAVEEMISILWQLYYYNDEIDCHIF